jgi:hypothetical protein
MKKLLMFVLPLWLFTDCKKDLGACRTYKKITGFEKVTDKNSVTELPLRDTLLKYPQLQLYEFIPYNFASVYGWNARCHVFYKDLMIFSDEYNLQLNAGPASYMLSTRDTIWTGPASFSLDPAVPYEKAIELAKKYVNFDHTCIAYQLGIYCTNRGAIFKYRNYCLAWKIQSDDGNLYVILDANQGYSLEISPRSSGWVD